MTVPLKPFEEMTPGDYHQLGLKSGLEIHQQLLTEKKLFCRCPAGKYSEEYDAEILRHMRPTLSELGEYDGTALMEFKTKKNIIYRINHETVCTYEMDDTPPFEINQQALDIALEIAMLLNYNLVSEIHISRKQYLDGSIPTGFQRTTIVGVDGWVPLGNRKIGLIQLGLEEDACREVSDVGHERIYLTDRLGMPLIEMVTQPDMHTPQEVAEVANLLRRLVRSTGKVRTGIGAARQDVNVSIHGGTRIEIKGVPRIPLIPVLIYNEARRQHALLQIREELHRRGITEKTFQYTSAEVTQLLTGASWDPIRHALKRREKIFAVNLRGFMGILSHPTQTGKVFSKEISDRVRVIACLTRLPNILTSESTEETIDSFMWKKIRNAVKARSNDAIILVWGPEEDVRTAVQEIVIRAREATVGVPSETRQALADGTNGFERILPGPDRMYPDTDLPPLEITTERIERIRKGVPEPVWEREKKYRKLGLPEHLIPIIAASPRAPMFEQLVEEFSVSPTQIARLLFEKTVAWQRAGWPVEKIEPSTWKEFLRAVQQQPALLEVADPIFEQWLQHPRQSLTDELKKFPPATLDANQLTNEMKTILQGKNQQFPAAEKKFRFVMRPVMEKWRGRIPGEQVAEMVRKLLADRGE